MFTTSPSLQSIPAQDCAPRQLDRAQYLILGVPITVASDQAEALAQIDETYASFRNSADVQDAAFSAELIWAEAAATDTCESAIIVRDSHGYWRSWPDAQAALIDLFDRIVHGVLAELHKRDIYMIHAGSLVYRGAALLIAGRSGQGKTTLTLGLLGRGLGLLSDEFAVVDPSGERILPYHRSVHIRPGTPELIPELRFVSQRPQRRLGGGIEWTLTPSELAQAFPGCLSPAAPIKNVLVLEGGPQPDRMPAITPIPAALATIELLRGTWAVSRDFSGGLARLGRLMNGVACARLQAGALEHTLDAICSWLEAQHG